MKLQNWTHIHNHTGNASNTCEEQKKFRGERRKKINTCEEWKSFGVREEKDFITLPCEKIHNKFIISSCAKKYTAKHNFTVCKNKAHGAQYLLCVFVVTHVVQPIY